MPLTPTSNHRRRQHLALATGILLVGAALRLVWLDRLPAGLSHDEAYNGVTALEVLLLGRRDVFFDIYNGIEPLVIYWEALYFQLFGIVPLAMRLVNYTAGMATIALTYAVARQMFRADRLSAPVVATLAALGVAISFWPVFLSRLALRAATLPLMELLAFYFLWRGLVAFPRRAPTRVLVCFALSGVWLGAAMYTYLSSRFLPLVPLLFFAWWLLRGRAIRRKVLLIVLFMTTWAVVFAPLAAYYVNHPDIFSRRADQVLTLPLALAGDPRPLFTSIWRTVGMFALLGPQSSRYGLAGRPVFEPVGAILLLAGLVVTVRRMRRPAREGDPYAFLLIWWLVMLLPAFITSESPHYLRTVGSMPPAFILWALGAVTVVHWLARAMRQQFAGLHASDRGVPKCVCVSLVSASTIYLAANVGLTAYDYFVRWANDAEARSIYGAEFAETARYLSSTHLTGPVALSAAHFRDWDRFRLDLEMRHHPPFVVWFDGAQTMLFPPPAVSPIYVFTRGAPLHPRWLPYLQLQMQGRDMEAYRLRPDATPRLATRLDATVLEDQFAGASTPQPVVRLLDYDAPSAAQAGRGLPILVRWQALMDVPGDPDYAFFAHLADQRGYVWAQADANGYGAVDWQPDVQVLQWLELPLPPDLPPLEYTLRMGLEERSSGRTLPLADTTENSVDLGSVRISPATRHPSDDDFRVPNAVQLDAGGVFILRGYSLSRRVVAPPDETHVSLFWEASAPPAQDYWLDVWLDDPQGRRIQLTSRQPLDGDYPTGKWQAGQWVRDRFDLTFPPEIPPEMYELFAGWRDASGRWLLDGDEQGVSLGQVLATAR